MLFRSTGQPSVKRIQQEQEAADRLARTKALGELERQGKALDRSIIDLSGDMRGALRERDQLQAERDRQDEGQPPKAGIDQPLTPFLGFNLDTRRYVFDPTIYCKAYLY